MANFVLTASARASSASVTIVEFTPKALVAPAQIWLKAVGHEGLAAFEEGGSVYDGAHHEYYHEWTIRGEPLATWNTPQNLAPGHNNPNKAFGKQVAFCLPKPGNYIVDLTVTDREGTTTTASSSIFTVVSADSHYSNAQSIYVDPDADYSGVPAGVPSANKVSTLAAARSRLVTLNNERTRLLFRRGKSYDFTDLNASSASGSNGSFWISDAARVSYIGDFGNTEDPNPKMLASTANGRMLTAFFRMHDDSVVTDFITFSNVDFEASWSPVFERGASHGPAISFDLRQDRGFGLAYNCHASGTEMGFGVSTRNGARLLLADCSTEDWRDYGIFGGRADSLHAFRGCRASHDPLTRGGSPYSLTSGQKNKDIMNGHGPCRLSLAQHIYMAECDFFSANAGWDGNAQPALRLLVDPEAGQSAHVERCCFEGGWQVIMLENSVSQVINPTNVVLERNLILTSAGNGSGKCISPWRSGVTLRDNVMYLPDVLPRAGGEPAIDLVSVNPQTDDNLTNPFVAHNNTYVNLMSAVNDRGRDWSFFAASPDFTDVIEENNVVHKPAMDTAPVTIFAPIDTTIPLSGVTPRYAGIGYNFQPCNFILANDVPNGGTVDVSYSIIRQLLMDQTDLGATGQAYWQAIEAIDIRHEIMLISVNGNNFARYYAEHGGFTVTFGASTVTLTNVSGKTWKRDENLYLNLDRTSLRPAFDTRYASPPTVPLPRPQAGSSAIGAATSGRVSSKDFLLTPRGKTPSKGALEPVI